MSSPNYCGTGAPEPPVLAIIDKGYIQLFIASGSIGNKLYHFI
jgi:hypothetical protein